MLKNINQVKMEVLKSGKTADASIEISKEKWIDIFKDLKIWSEGTKRKYKKSIEDDLSKEIKLKK